MANLNYHHLHYFWAVAKEGNLTRAAKRLHVSQSSLSVQIRQLEDQLGQELFTRNGRKLVLTEAGRLACSYAERIFETGAELMVLFKQGERQRREVLRIGAVSTLSRNFQESFVEPLMSEPDVQMVLQAGSLTDLMTRLANHALDLVLTNSAVQADAQNPWRCRLIARQAVSVVGRLPPPPEGASFPEVLGQQPLLLPGHSSEIRGALDVLAEQHEMPLNILAEVDDMALLRLLARDNDALAVLPSVVVRDELRTGALHEYLIVPGLYEHFYAITVKRHYQHPLLKALLARTPQEVLHMGTRSDAGDEANVPDHAGRAEAGQKHDAPAADSAE
ncbi:MAG: LysR family transcriptional regulator [Gammaproteobacteria bacterium]|nr:LysR family transcriptional regulator [Gammaproteobacteria bacterium]